MSTTIPDVPPQHEKQFHGRIRNSFLLILLPITTLFIVIMGSVTYLQARSIVENQVNAQLNANLNSLVSDIDQWLAAKQIRLDLLIRNESFRQAVFQILEASTPQTSSPEAARKTIQEGFQSTLHTGRELLFNDFFIATPKGIIVFASNPELEGTDISDTDYFYTLSSEARSLLVYSPEPFYADEAAILTSAPLYNQYDQTKAIIFGLSGSLSIQNQLSKVTRFNPEARGYVITQSGDFIGFEKFRGALGRFDPSQDQLDISVRLSGISSTNGQSLSNQIVSVDTLEGERMIANFAWVPRFAGGVVLELPYQVAFGGLDDLTIFSLISTLSMTILLTAAILFVTQRLVKPLRDLTQITSQFAQGNWEQRAVVKRDDELGLLANAFNRMATDLADLYHSLEVQVGERTQSLEKRNRQLEATAQVAREAAGIRDLDELLSYATHLISEHFGYYHTGIFLIDQAGKYAVLQAANSEGGQRMLARRHRLEVGQTGVVGYVAAMGVPRIALDVGDEPFYFDNPDLPNTHSELALPLTVRGQIIGVLDVQSTERSAFEHSDVEVLQILADQLALAIENARLLEQSNIAIQELRTAYGEQLKGEWLRHFKGQVKAYQYDRIRVSPAPEDYPVLAEDHPKIHSSNDGHFLSVPISLRGIRLGTLQLKRESDEKPWSKVDLALVEDLVSQIAVVLDNARLLAETRRRAEHEQTLSEISARLSRLTDIDSILKAAIRELSQLPNVAGVSLQIKPLEN